jgi:hypothetical protein
MHQKKNKVTWMSAADSPLSLDVLCLYVVVRVPAGIVVVCRNNARSVLAGSQWSHIYAIISVLDVNMSVGVLLLLLNRRNLILHLLNVLLSMIALNVLSLPWLSNNDIHSSLCTE